MSTARNIALFAAGLLVVFGAAAALGSTFEPADTESDAGHMEMREGGEEKMESHSAHQTEAGHAPAGLAISEGGYTLRLTPTQWGRGEARELRFSIDGADGPVTNFDELHERRMHLIVVRRDGTGFRHLHPEMDEAGTWSIPIRFEAPGVYRAFADFSVEGEQHTLAGDLFVSGGEFEARPFPPERPVDSTGDYEVRLRAGEPVAGEPTSLSFSVAEGGQAVADLSPYLGAKGHLVALREGDLAFLHVHPEEDAEADEIPFAATFPTAGRYRLYLQFKHDGAVQTVEYTVVVPR
jgi:hypothetical protein